MTDQATDDDLAHRQRVDALLRQGKNVYQPLYNFPYPQAIAALRPCADRCRAVEASMGGAVAGRRLWDMGCSLGYNTFWFVDRGMTGTGIDIDPRNIALCREISRWTAGEARFEQGELTREMVEAMIPGSHDYGFLFSMLHHVIEARGLAYVQALMQALTARIPVLYVELALGSETPPPGYDWARHLPGDELAIFATCEGLSFELIGHFPTHVGPVTRPIYRVTRGREN